MLDANQKKFLTRWVIDTFSVLLAAHLVSGIRYDNLLSLTVATLVMGLFNATLKPLLLLLSLPLLIFTLGLFWLVINAFLFYLVGWLIPGFTVVSFGAAFWGALLVSVFSSLVFFFVGGGNWKVEYNQRRRGPVRSVNRPSDRRRSRAGKDDDDSGPIIDV